MLPDIQPGNTKILYFFNCLLDGMHTKIKHICDFSRGGLNVRLRARIQTLLLGHKYALVTLTIQRVLNLLPHFQSQRYQSYPLIPSQHLGIRMQEVSVRGGYFLLQGREGQVKR